MPPKTPPAKKGKAEAPPAEPDEDELLAKLAEKELEAVRAQEKLQQLERAKDTLGSENISLSSEVDRTRTNLRDISEYLGSENKAKAARIAALEAQLASAQQELAAAGKKAEEDVEEAVQQYKAELEARAAELAAAQERVKAYDTFIAEKDSMQKQLQSLTNDVDELKKQHHMAKMDLERKHAQDRELWKRDTAAAIKHAREEMMALTDNRLEITTKRTILENEQMSGELQYQSRQVQNMVTRNEALQRELSQLRVALELSKKGEEELVRKNRVCERTIETLLVRLESQDAERGSNLVVEYAQRIAGLEDEVHMAVVQLDERAGQVQMLERALTEARQQLQRARDTGSRLGSSSRLAQFLTRCLEDIQQQLAASAEGPESQLGEPDFSRMSLEQRQRLLQHLLDSLRKTPEGEELVKAGILPA